MTLREGKTQSKTIIILAKAAILAAKRDILRGNVHPKTVNTHAIVDSSYRGRRNRSRSSSRSDRGKRRRYRSESQSS